jgi:hypothetical protein
MREGTRTVLAMQNDYQGPPESFAMVVPVPVILQKENVKTLPRAIFEHLDQMGAPTRSVTRGVVPSRARTRCAVAGVVRPEKATATSRPSPP